MSYPLFDSNVEKRFRHAQFITSATCLAQCPASASAEIAFVGRSNVGKSSVINALCHQKRLAKTSKTPGRTQLINFFQAGDNFFLIDLPGYGYASVSREKQHLWQKEITRFLTERQSLSALVLIIDIRHLLKDSDKVLLYMADSLALPVHILLNKADKLSRNQANQTLFKLRQTITAEQHKLITPERDDEPSPFTLQTFSATTRQGLDTFYQHVASHWLPAEDPQSEATATHNTPLISGSVNSDAKNCTK